MDGSKKRRVAGAAAFSATAIASLLGAQPASAAPPGIATACQSRPGPDTPDASAFPVKWQGLRCTVAPDGTTYQWWLKVE